MSNSVKTHQKESDRNRFVHEIAKSLPLEECGDTWLCGLSFMLMKRTHNRPVACYSPMNGHGNS